MVYSLTYRRPSYVAMVRPASSSKGSSENERASSTRSGVSGIPEALSFDKIINDGTCPPCTTRDFLNYLLYIEHAAENLQFYLWFLGYEKRFSDASELETDLAPVWTQEQQDAALQAAQHDASTHRAKIHSPSKSTEIFGGSGLDSPGAIISADTKDPFSTPPFSPRNNTSRSNSDQSQQEDAKMSAYTSEKSEAITQSYHQAAKQAFNNIGLYQPFTVQPFRVEIERVIATYIIEDSPRQLNLSGRERTVVLKALNYTTHPSALRCVLRSTEQTLRCQSHPNFIRWTICNGNRPRVMFARGLGIFLLLAAFVTAIVVTLSKASRGWRAFAAIGWVSGFATLICAWKGMCVVLHGMHSRHVRPWELFQESQSQIEEKKSFETFDTSNSYEDEPWVAMYKKRNILRKILDRQVWVQEPALRQIQDTIFLQSILEALIASVVLTAIFVAVPSGNMF